MPPGTSLSALSATKLAVFLLMLVAVVHAAGSTSVAAQKAKSPTATDQAPIRGLGGPDVRTGTAGLPAPVMEMREAIAAAVRSGRIEDLTIAIELNEIKPTFGDGPAADPIGWLKAQSSDGEGRDILAALGLVLEAPYAVVPMGRDLENNRMYVWPSFAETGVKDLTPEQVAELQRLAPEAEAKTMRESGRYTGWHLRIGADGTWHVLGR